MEPSPEQREKWELQQIKQSQSRLNAKPIASVMRKLLNSKSYGAIQSSQSLNDLWPMIVDVQLARSTRLGRVSRGALLIEANSSQALQELHFQSRTILKRLQAELPHQKIIRLQLRMASF